VDAIDEVLRTEIEGVFGVVEELEPADVLEEALD
jgi:hypothetical protein